MNETIAEKPHAGVELLGDWSCVRCAVACAKYVFRDSLLPLIVKSGLRDLNRYTGVEEMLSRNSSKLALALAGTMVLGTAVAMEPLQEVVVHAERVTSTVVGRSSLGAPIELLELRHRVSYADLNLATPSGAAALEKRVQDAATAACDELDKLYPLSTKDRNCAKKASDAAMPQVHAAVAAAEAKAKAGTK